MQVLKKGVIGHPVQLFTSRAEIDHLRGGLNVLSDQLHVFDHRLSFGVDLQVAALRAAWSYLRYCAS